MLERLVERGRVYHLSAALYRQLGAPAGYVRAHGFDPIRQEAMVMEYVAAHERITRGEAADLCSLTGRQANHLLSRLVAQTKLRMRGERRGAYYEFPGRKKTK